MKKLSLITLVLIFLLSAFTVSAQSVEDYTVSRLNDKVDVYHITSEKQIENGVKGGEGAQLVYTMAVSPHNDDIMLLGNNTSGIYRSTDGGASWSHSSEGILSQCIDSLAFDPDDENIAYAMVATGSNSSKRVSLGKKIGLYKSIDGGVTWEYKLQLCNERSIGRLIAFGTTDENGTRPMFAASSNAADYETLSAGATGIWRSYDRGETWQCIGLEDRSIMTLYSDEDMLVAVSDKGIDISYDNGDSFISANGDLPYISSSAFTVDPANKSHWTVGSRFTLESGRRGGMLYETFDNGISWTPVNGEYYGWESTTYICSLDYIYPEGKTTPRLLMAVYRLNNPNRYSDDFGKTFTKCEFRVGETYGLYDTYTGFFTLPFCINPKNGNEVFTSMIVPYKSTDGGETFSYSGSGYSGMAAYDYHFDSDGAFKYIAITDVGFSAMNPVEGTIFSPSGGISDITNPSYVSAKSSTSLAVDPKDENHGFAAMGGFIYDTPTTLLESTDGFKTLRPIAGFELLNEANPKTVSKVWYHPGNSRVVYTDYYVSEDNGVTWRETEHPIRGVSPFDGDTVYSLDNYEIYISRDRGASWTATDLGVNNNGAKYGAFCVDSHYRDVIWTGDYSLLYRIDISNNYINVYEGGRTKLCGTTGNKLEFTGIMQNPGLKNHLLLSARDLTGGGSFVFESFDYGVNWETLDCFPYLAYENPVEFHPTENIALFSGMMGTLAYHWDRSSWYVKSELTYSGYDFDTQAYSISGHTDSGYYGSPVTVAITNDSGETSVYFTNTDDKGNFEFTAKNISVNSGEYMVRIGIMGKEDYMTDSFFTGEILAPEGKFRAIYNPETQNFIICGKSDYKDTVSFVLKDRRYDITGISNPDFLSAVKYVGEIVPDSDGDYVYKFRFIPEEGRKPSDYNINVMTDSAVYENITVETVSGKDYNFTITANSDDTVDFTSGKRFSLDIKWHYFLENKLDTRVVAAMYDESGSLTGVYMSERSMNYDASSETISGTVPEGSCEMRVFVWSDLCPLENIKRYTAKGE